MRLGIDSSDDFLNVLGVKTREIQDMYRQKVTDLAGTTDVKVMMGDSTVTSQKTFDPSLLEGFFQGIIGRLEGWSVQGVSTSNNEDIRRIFFKFEKKVGNYLVSGHFSIQFHVLLYYRPDQRVIDCQKELSDLVDLTKDKEQQFSDNSDQFVLHKLKEMGHRDFDHQTLFETFYENDDFREDLYREIEERSGVDFHSLSEKKNKLFDELDSLLLETYQMSPVLIDDTRLVAGEEGCLCTLDIEFVKNKSKQGVFDPKKMSDDTKALVVQSLDDITSALKGSA